MAIAVTGCQTIGTTTQPPLKSLAIYAEDEGSAGAALDNGETLHAYNASMSSAVLLDDVNGIASSAGAPDFSIRETATGDVVVSVNGVETTFTDADNEGWGFEQNGVDPGDPNYSLASWSAPDVDDALATGKHHQIWRYWWYPGAGGASTVGFAAVGTETKAAAVEGRTVTATYQGYAGAVVAPTDDPGAQQTLVGDDLTITANFDSARISGSVTDLRLDPSGTNTAIVGGEIMLVETDIVGNGFNGQIAANQDLIDAFGGSATAGDPLGSYGGKFYGPNGEEIAGVFSIGLDDYVAAGFFSADEVP